MTSKESVEATSVSDVTNVPLLDVGRGNSKLREAVLKRMGEVYDAGCFVFGPDCKELESRVAELSEAEHGIGCASGSDALLLALMAHEIGPGDEVLVPSFTFFATASAVWRLGATPVFVDIDPLTFNLDPAHAESLVTSETRAIIPVHLFGQCADMERICEMAEKHELIVIEDAAQAIGAKFNQMPAGSMGHVGCFSFYPTKNLGGCGDAGLMTTSDEQLAVTLKQLTNHGMEPRYFHSMVGVNSRLDTFQAVALNAKLDHIEEYTQSRQENADYYRELIADAGLTESIVQPHADERCEHVWNQFTVRIPGGYRDQVRQSLRERGVGSEIYYPIPLHLQECFASLGYEEGDLPHTEKAASEVLSLPIFPELEEAEQARVVRAISDFMSKRRAAA